MTRETNTIVIIPTNYNRSKRCDKPIRIPCSDLSLSQSVGKIARAEGIRKRCDRNNRVTSVANKPGEPLSLSPYLYGLAIIAMG